MIGRGKRWGRLYLIFVSAWLLLLSRTAHGFGIGHVELQQMVTRNAIPRQPTTSTAMSSTATSTITDHVESSMQRNMFQDYDKPIVLVGCSSEDGNELYRLAESFLSDLFPSTDKKSMILDGTEQDLISSIVSKTYSWPNIVVIDLKEDYVEEQYANLAKSLYKDLDLLAIYINVHPVHSKMSESAAARKSRLEETVLVPYTDYEICIQNEGSAEETEDGSSGWEHIQWEFARTLARARLAPAVPGAKESTINTAHLTMGDHTFFLSLSFPDISQVESYVEQMCQDVDAMEYRTDLLACRDSRFDLIYGMQLLRRYCRPNVVRVPALPAFGALQVMEDVMPIVYTVRTQNQAGTYPDDPAGIDQMFNLLDWGLRGGVEVLDVESAWDADKTNALLTKAERRYASQILGSHHVVGQEVSIKEAVGLFQNCALDGRAHGAKVVLSIKTSDKDRMAHEAAIIASSLAARDGKPVIPNISLILGDVGRFSRVVNLPFTPVTHESLPFKAAPGQMTSNEIMAARILMKIMSKKNYCILGHNIAYSVSPQMQGAAFAATRLPHGYGRADVETVQEFVDSDFFKDPAFGGCSVTIPHKQAIMPYVDVLSESAKAIGSVNTLIAKVELGDDDLKRTIYGDNTDWKGIFNPLNRKLGAIHDESKDICLILGGGGTARAAAYAASKLGLQRVYFNRTPSKAEELVEAFGGTVVTSLDKEVSQAGDGAKSIGDVLSVSEGSSVKVVISTLPAAAEFVLPDWFVAQDDKNKPIIFDVNYKPFYTELLKQAETGGCQVVRGSEMLWEQGVGQFELWTQRTAPYGVMKAVVLENCLPNPLDAPKVLQ
jgi:shikimate dehydrogenase/3-dehydroquinate dehydratase type I